MSKTRKAKDQDAPPDPAADLRENIETDIRFLAFVSSNDHMTGHAYTPRDIELRALLYQADGTALLAEAAGRIADILEIAYVSVDSEPPGPRAGAGKK